MTDKILLNLEILVKQMAKTMGQNKEITEAVKSLPPVDFTSLIAKLNEVADRLDKEFPKFPEIKIPDYPKFPDIPKIDLSDVRELLKEIKAILNKQEKPDMSELAVISSLLNKLIESINAQKKDNFIDKIKVEVSKIFEKNDVGFKITEDQFKEIVDLLKAIKARPSDGGGGGYKQVAVENKLGRQINPATEEKQDSLIAKDFATEGGNLALIKAKTDNLDVLLSAKATEATLAAIKDTAGIKKIADALPAGTNEIGAVLVSDLYVAIKLIANLLARPLWIDPTTSRMKADAIISSGTVTTVTTAGTLTNLGTANVTGKFIDNLTWGQNIRSRIT